MIMFKRFITTLVVMLCFSAAHCFAALSIHLLDKNSLEKEEIISNLLALQGTWQIDIRNPPAKEKSKDGFLFVRMKPSLRMITPDPVPVSPPPETPMVTTDGSSLAAIDATDVGLVSCGVGAPVPSNGPEGSVPAAVDWPCDRW